MTTRANIIVLGDIVFSVMSDGYPDEVIPFLLEIAKKCKNEKEFIGELTIESNEGDWLEMGKVAYPDYEYTIDFGTRTITYEEEYDDGKLIEKSIKF